MWSWLSRLVKRQPIAQAQQALPPWVDEVFEAAQKFSRGQARLQLRIEEVERKVEAGFSDLRSICEEVAERPASGATLHWDDVLDALDLIDQAAGSIAPDLHPGLADGLGGIGERLERFLAQSGLERIAEIGVAPDGRLFRIVGTAEVAELADGLIARVVRAAVIDGDRVVREGEAVINRKTIDSLPLESLSVEPGSAIQITPIQEEAS